MQKINNFFPHDFHARDDTKLKKVRMLMGMEGIGLYWCIIEFLYENNGYLNICDIDMLSYELRIDKDKILNLIENFNLFKVSKNKFCSQSVLSRIKIINEKSEKARRSVQARWDKKRQQKESNTEVLHDEYECDTSVLPIKESKRKESKIEENNINDIQSISNNIYSFTEQNFGRCLSPIEIEKINFWLNEFSEEVLKEAISIAVMNRKCNFAYINAILNDWKGKGLQSLLEIREETQKFSKRKESISLTDEEKELLNYNWYEDND